MNRLLRRASSVSAAGTPQLFAAPPSDEPQEAAQQSDASVEKEKAPVPGGEYLPRSLAPERMSNMAAMRELANMTARMAIDKSTRQRMGSAAIGKLAIAGVGLIGGVALVVLQPGNSTALSVGATMFFVVAAFWILQAGMIAKNFLNNGDKSAKTKDRSADAELKKDE
jgi:hypothetical protein